MGQEAVEGAAAGVPREPRLPSPNLPPAELTVPSAQSIPTAIPSDQALIVRSIEVRSIGAGVVDRNRILANMSLKVGSTFTQDKSDADIKNLIATGDVANVNIIPEPEGDGVKVVVMVEARTNLGEVAFLGNSAISSKVLQDEAELRIGAVVDEAKLQEAQRKIQELYQKRGFPDVGITYRQEKAADTGFTRVTFIINEGQRALLHKIRFEGNTVFSERELRKITDVGERDWWRVWNWTKRISNEKVEATIATLEAKYQDNGYMNARVVGVDRVPAGDKVDLVFRISEGQKFDITAVGIEGMTTFPKEELLPSLQLTAGEPYSAGNIKADMRMIRDYYGARGYADVSVTPRIARAGGNQLAVTYLVAEGTKSYVRKINIEGNTKTKDEVIRRELAVVPGEEFSTTKLQVSQRRLENLGYFEQPVDFTHTETETAGYKDINIAVREKSTGSVQLGAGFSSIDSLIGILEVTQTNFDLFNWPSFTGAGQRFRSRIQYGLKRRDFELDFTEPWFMGQRLAFGTELYYRDLLYLSDYYDQQVFGGALSLTKPLGEHARLRTEYRLQNVEIYNVDAGDRVEIDPDATDPRERFENRGGASEAIEQEQGTFLQSTLGLIYTHDTRDVLLGVTRKGHKVSAEGYFSGLGGDVETYQLSLSGSQYISLPFDSVFKIEGAIDVIDAWGGERVPIFQRQFLGGANNLRGFDFRDVGPKDENGEPLGGLTSTYVTAEYNFPLFWKMRGVIFADMGMVSSSYFDFGGDWNTDVGLGLHLYGILPQGPIRFEVGFPIQSDEFNDDGAQFNFNIGYRF
ncbi:MAG: outer membrane protein assembly factor BamA [Verrucomicrobiales bacterium]